MTHLRRLTALLLGGLLYGRGASAQDAPSVRLVVSAGLQGDLARLACAPQGQRAAGFAAVVRALHAGPADAVRLDAGDLFGASALSHLATRDHLPALVDAVAASGLRALAVGHRDLGGDRADLVARARALSARGVHTVLSNLRCDDEARALCDAVVDAGDEPVVIPSPAGGIGVVALMAPASLRAVARDQAAGVTLTAPEEALGRATLAARAAGARYVVAFYDPEAPGTLTDTVRMVRALPRDQRPDVVFAQDLAGDLATLEVERGAALRVFATEPRRVVETALPAPATPTVVEPAGDEPAALTTFQDAVSAQLCRLGGEVLAGATLTRPLDRDGFTRLLLDVMREASRSEVSVINRGAVRPIPTFPLAGRISRLDVMGALPYDDTLRVARVKGEALEAFVRSAAASHFRVQGVTVDGSSLLVNGRPLERDQEYRVVTSGFVADGGDGGIGEDIEFATWGTVGPRDLLLG